LGTSRETSACVCDAIALAWQEDRAEHYPHAQQILLTFDAGAANTARSLRFKEDLVALSRRFGRRLRVALYPPYTSKRHPIEHRLFCHVARCLSGVILDSHQTAAGSGTAHPHPNRLHGHATPARYPLRAGTKEHS